MKLRKMTGEEFDAYITRVIRGYAEEQVNAGSWTADSAMKLSQAEIHDLLPNGLDTRDHFLYSLVVEEEPAPVGVLWIMVRKRNNRMEAFIDDIEIFEKYRRRGYAAQALDILEDTITEKDIHTIRLHVFGHNHAARALYENCGYEVVNIYMEKRIK